MGQMGHKKKNKHKKKKEIPKNILSSAFGSVLLATQSYSLSDNPPKLAAVRPPRTAPLIDDLIWELT